MFQLSHRILPLTMQRLARLLIVPLVALAFGVQTPLAAYAASSIVVDSLSDKQAPDGHCTLREAVIAANTNAPVDSCAAGGQGEDIITFRVSGTIILGTNLPKIPLVPYPSYSGPAQQLTIRGPGADRLTISGNTVASVLSIEGWLNLENVTIVNSNVWYATAIQNWGSLNITNTSFPHGSTTTGNAILNSGSLNITNSSFSGGNTIDGGAIFNLGSLNITNSSFSNNRATGQSACEYRKELGKDVCSYHGGGAIFNQRGHVTVTGSSFSNNRADTGGAIYNHGGALNISSSFFSNNSASGMLGGGSVKSDALQATSTIVVPGSLNVTSSTFTGNRALSSNGGGIDGDELSVANSTFASNNAVSNGGGINSRVRLTVANSTFIGNNAASGGGLYAAQNSFTPTLKNTIIADSAGGNCGGPIVPSGTANLVTDASCGLSAIQTSSAALGLGPLQDNGGPTKTIAPQAGSIAIDSGDAATCAAEPVSNSDQRGQARPQGPGCDIGSVEVKLSYPPVAKEDTYTTVANSAQPLSVDAAHGLLANDYDQDGDTLQAALSSEPSYGQLALNADGSFTYTPDKGFQGIDSFAYRASGGSRDSDPATVTIAVSRVAAADDSYTIAQNTALTVDVPGVLANDAQADGKPLLAKLIGEPKYGKLTLNDDGSFVYIPEEGFRETDSFVYVASDSIGVSNTAIVTIAIAR